MEDTQKILLQHNRQCTGFLMKEETEVISASSGDICLALERYETDRHDMTWADVCLRAIDREG